MGRVDDKRIAMENAYIETFEVGEKYRMKYCKDVIVKLTSKSGVRGVCFTGIVLTGNKEYPSGMECDGWVYFSFENEKL